jgi:hypothetical protein
MAATTAVVAGTAGAVSHHQQQKYANQAAEQQAAAAAAAPPPEAYAPPPAAAPAEDRQMAQLEKLAQLHTAGILSDEEFAAAKPKALGIDPWRHATARRPTDERD